jgi:hypothetical protein
VSEEVAEAALNLNNTDVGGRMLLVEHSDPSARAKSARGGGPSRGRGRGGFGDGRPRDGANVEGGGDRIDRPMFAPRGARLGLGAARGRGARRVGLGAATEATASDAGGSNQQPSASSADSQPKPAARSNDEFRKMFLQGKNL